MPATTKWAIALTSIVLGLGLVLEPNLIRMLPVMVHYIIGAVLIILGGSVAYTELK